jgi:hypothetical protein
MYYTKEQQIERIVLEYCAAAASATLQVVKSPPNLSLDGATLSDKERKVFATGVMCMMDGIKEHLLPKIKEALKENPRFFENNN